METTNGIHTWNNKPGGENQIFSLPYILTIIEYLIPRGMDWTATMILPGNGPDLQSVCLHFQLGGDSTHWNFHFQNLWLDHLEFLANIIEHDQIMEE